MAEDLPRDLDERIRQRAHQIWEREGRPDGRSQDHWKLASEEIAIEDNYRDTLMPNPARGPDDTAARTEPVEPVLSMANQGEMPGIADQGEEFQIPGAGDRDAWPDRPEQAGAEEAVSRLRPATRRPRRSGA